MKINDIIIQIIRITNQYSHKFLPNKLARLIEKYLTAEIIRYLLVGAGSAFVLMLASNIMYSLIPQTMIATFVGWVLAIVYGYFAHMHITFQVQAKHKTYAPRFLFLTGLNFVFNMVGAWLLHDVIGIGYAISMLILSVIWPVISYLIMKFHTFKTLATEGQSIMTFEELINIYPKTRPELPQEYQDIYVDHHQTNRNPDNSAGVSLSAKLEQWMHVQVQKPFQDKHDKRILEIGAGTFNHVKSEGQYAQYDVVEPFKALYENQPEQELVNTIYDSVFDVPENNKYDKVISIAVLEHVEELPYIIAKSALLMDKDAVFNLGIPSEGTPLWKLGYTMTTGIEFKKRYGLKYETMMKYEHINTAKEIEQVCNLLFNDITYKSFGFCKFMSLYQYFECRQPNIELCKQLMQHYHELQENKG